MKTELFTVSRIFTESIYRIPDYQRGYSWGEDQLRDFWLDLEQLQPDGKHYTGVLTLEEVPQEKWSEWIDDAWIITARRYKPYYVVDGQQRLTTVIILIQVILEEDRLAHLNYTAAVDVRKKYVFDSKPEELARSYIFGYEKDNPSYEFLKKRIFLEQSDIHLQDEDTIYTKNLIADKTFFKDRVKKLDESQLQELFTKVTQQLVFNVYEITSDIDVFVTFETMNNRGKPLSTLELLKNRLIYLSTKLPAPIGSEGKLRRMVNDAWKSAYHYLGKNDNRPLSDDTFLKTHLSYFYISDLVKIPADEEEGRQALGRYVSHVENYGRFLLNSLFSAKRVAAIPAGSVKNGNGTYEGLPDLTPPFINSFSQHLKDSVELYFKLCNPSQSAFSDAEKIWLERLGRLSGYSPSAILLALFKKERKAEKRVRLLEQIERLAFLQSMRLSYYYGRRFRADDFFIKYASDQISTDDLIRQYENKIDSLLKEVPLTDILPDWVKAGDGYYGWKSIKYFLYEYELDLQMRSSPTREKINWKDFSREDYRSDYETVEHIYPQRARDKYWLDRFGSFTVVQKRMLRNSLGNLLALSRPRNSSLSNKAFPIKRDDTNGFRTGSYSEIEVSRIDEWNAEQILRRGIKLLEFFEKRWKITIGDDNQKLRVLGLSFMSKSKA